MVPQFYFMPLFLIKSVLNISDTNTAAEKYSRLDYVYIYLCNT
jgi:hypothetical protein